MTRVEGYPSFVCSHLGVAKSILLPVHVNGAQKLLRSIFAINKLPFRDGAGIEDPVPGWGVELGWSDTCRQLGVGGGLGGEGPLAAQSWEGAPSMQFPECLTLLLSAQGPHPCQGPAHSVMTQARKAMPSPEGTRILESHQGLGDKSLPALGRAHRKERRHLPFPSIWLWKLGQASHLLSPPSLAWLG